jgi:transcriptional regulator with XRE-family HTH domain/tetratricopeptide (TPR) repeat protein
MTETAVGSQLRTLRLERGFTLERLAEASGVSVRGISDIERGVRDRPRRSTVDAICNALEVDRRTGQVVTRLLLSRFGPETPVEAVQPHRVHDFVGRDDEMQALLPHLRHSSTDGVPRSAIVAGPPGVGKTAFAIEVTRRLLDRDRPSLYLDLLGPNVATARPALSVMQALLRQVLTAEEGDPPSTLDACVARWQTKCSSEERVIILDNAADEAQIRPVLAGGGVKVIITSRRSLAGLEDVERVHLDRMPIGDSIRLLELIVPEAQRTDSDLERLARLCGDLPLALRIAGNRIASQPFRTAGDFVRRMGTNDRRLESLVAGDLSVEAAFQLSYDDLDDLSSRIFRHLSLIYGVMFDAQLVGVLMGEDQNAMEDCLDGLVELGLLEFVGQSRYRLHDLLRLFAGNLLRLEHRESAELAQNRMREWLMATAISAGQTYAPDAEANPPERPTWMTDRTAANTWIRRNHEHWWPAFKHTADLERCDEAIDLAEAFHWFSDTWMAWNSWHDFYTLAVRVAQRMGDKRVESIELGYLARSDLVEQGDVQHARLHATASGVAAAESGDELALGWADYYQGWCRHAVGDYAGAADFLTGAVAHFDGRGFVHGSMQARSLLGSALRAQGHPQEAIQLLTRVVHDASAADTGKTTPTWTYTEVVARLRIAESLLDLGRAEEAHHRATNAVRVAEDAQCALSQGTSHFTAARTAMAVGRDEEAELHIEAGIRHTSAHAGASTADALHAKLEALRAPQQSSAAHLN